jgi:preprotein translocase subunit SecY
MKDNSKKLIILVIAILAIVIAVFYTKQNTRESAQSVQIKKKIECISGINQETGSKQTLFINCGGYF